VVASFTSDKSAIHFVEAPKISDISSDKAYDEGSDVTLICVSSGIPSPKVVWYRKDHKSLPASVGGGIQHVVSLSTTTSFTINTGFVFYPYEVTTVQDSLILFQLSL